MDAEETQTHVPRNTTRNRDETKEEKKQRKQEIKNDRKVGWFEAWYFLVFSAVLTLSRTSRVMHSSRHALLLKAYAWCFLHRLENNENSTRLNLSVVCLLQMRRMEKKANKIAFKSEKQRQEQSLLNTKQQQGKKLWGL